jgi:[glutamine synthetase] adenylyltransferase / [glutamine synthetase]-adenylyl-L-tyrosine phosphorylase
MQDARVQGRVAAPPQLASPAAWEDPERAARTLERLPQESGLAAQEVAQLEELCARSADPDGALFGASRALAARRERFGRPARTAVLASLVAICAASRFLAAHLATRPRLLDLLAHPRFVARGRSRRDATAAALSLLRGLAPGDPGAPGQLALRLRRHKVVEVLRISVRDLIRRAAIPEVTRELSRLAAAAFEASVRFHYARLCLLHGAPEGRSAAGPSGFCVLGMGKLGGEELNFSSDVDVLYCYDKDGRTQGGPQGAVDHFAFYAKLAEEVTRAVGASVSGEFVFRVDLELRPEGRSGPIVNALRGLELYYEAQGAGWERFALLKARPIAGNLAVGEEGLRRLAPFVWRKYLDLSAVEEMRALKARAERQAGRSGGLDLKLGPGGIREVEFFTQALQLLHGGRDANLRERGTLRALERLLFAGLLSSRDRDELSEAYIVLRRLEHRLQMVAERQTHSLPVDERERAKLARRAGHPSLAAMEDDLAVQRGRVHARFSDLLRVAGGEPPAVDPRAEVAADPQATDDERRAALAGLGFHNAEASAAEMRRLVRKRGTPFAATAPADLAAKAPQLVGELAAAPDPDQALRHLAELFGQLSDPSATARLLAGSPRTARLLISLFGSSDFLSRSLLRHPELIDQLVHRGSAPLVRSRETLQASLRERLLALPEGHVEEQLTEMRRFRNEEVLRIGLHDVAGALDAGVVGEQLSDLAEVCVEACLALAQREVEARDGKPRLADGKRAALVVIALGKLGGQELGYHSDLDLLFLYSGGEDLGEAAAEAAGAQAEPPLNVHFARVAQRLISHLTLPLREGPLYRIDTRLRPSGSAGPLVVSFEALARYHEHGRPGEPHSEAPRAARLWERQALLRARPVAGDFTLFARAQREVLEKSLFRPLDARGRAEAASELLAMRERMERELGAETSARYNSKLGRGGLVDVEFAVQFLQLVHGSVAPAIRKPGTLQALAEEARLGYLAAADKEPLERGYRFLRRLESRVRIVRDRPIDHLPTSGRELTLLARRLGYAGARCGEELLTDYARATAAVRAAFLRVLGLPPGHA